jgi:SAM-dependent methyltransferase
MVWKKLMVRPLSLEDFEERFRDDSDPWQTLTSRPEAVKRRHILRAAGHRRWGCGLELAAGNGSNSAALAARIGRLDVCEATAAGHALAGKAAAACPNIRLWRHIVPEPFPADRYDLIVIAELLYYLRREDLRHLAEEITRTLRPAGRLILVHHHCRFPDARLDGARVHDWLTDRIGARLLPSFRKRTRLWTLLSLDRSVY